ncbi:hypothetical protein ACROYT_G024283 [Oculina patagonica]
MNRAFSEIFHNLQEIEAGTKIQKEQVHHQRISRKVSAPAAWVPLREAEETTTAFEQPQQEMKRKFAVITTPALKTVSSLPSLVNIEQVDIGLSSVDKVIEEDFEKQIENVDLQPRRRRVSAPVKTLIETAETTFKQPIKELRGRKFSEINSPALSPLPSLQSLAEEELNIDQVDIGFDCNDDEIEKVSKKQKEDAGPPRRRRVSAPARTMTETTETTTTFKQLRKDFVRKISRPTLLPDLTLSTMPWLECFEEELEENFEPVEFNLSFLDDLMKA